ncbi:MAG: hypothetical protein Fur005_09610 [Roseiflexaceae bacterium]
MATLLVAAGALAWAQQLGSAALVVLVRLLALAALAAQIALPPILVARHAQPLLALPLVRLGLVRQY